MSIYIIPSLFICHIALDFLQIIAYKFSLLYLQ